MKKMVARKLLLVACAAVYSTGANIPENNEIMPQKNNNELIDNKETLPIIVHWNSLNNGDTSLNVAKKHKYFNLIKKLWLNFNLNQDESECKRRGKRDIHEKLEGHFLNKAIFMKKKCAELCKMANYHANVSAFHAKLADGIKKKIFYFPGIGYLNKICSNVCNYIKNKLKRKT
ncbi:uncharacterized protein LOC142324985 isoform X4 [Lycorma delicatula]|uniref:uncharacterized protein LOC142324985 isoform X4 n=1 Tax=Lycorma delicatula TaxID=130591 RepID=UPI003F51573C